MTTWLANVNNQMKHSSPLLISQWLIAWVYWQSCSCFFTFYAPHPRPEETQLTYFGSHFQYRYCSGHFNSFPRCTAWNSRKYTELGVRKLKFSNPCCIFFPVTLPRTSHSLPRTSHFIFACFTKCYAKTRLNQNMFHLL